MYVPKGYYNTAGDNVLDLAIMATVKRTATVGDLFIEFSGKEIEIYRIAPDGSGILKRVDDTQGEIRRIAEEAGFERDYNLSYRQHVARLIQYINGLENKKNDK